MKTLVNIIFISCTLLIFSCVKELDYNDLNFKRQLVLSGLVYQDSIIRINVSTTKSILVADSVLTFLDDAEVRLYTDDEFIETLQYDSLGMYHSTTIARENMNYTIEASAQGLTTATAKLFLKNPIDIRLENVDYTITDTLLSIDKPVKTDINLKLVRLNFDLLFTDNSNEENFYDYTGFCKNIEYTTNYIYDEDYNQTLMNEIYESNTVYLTFKNPYDYNFFYPNDKATYNGYEQNNFIVDDKFNGNEIRLGLKTYYYALTADSFNIVLFSYPYDYIHYHFTGYRYIMGRDNAFTQPSNIHTNIENGLGLVCAVTTSKQTIYLDLEQ